MLGKNYGAVKPLSVGNLSGAAGAISTAAYAQVIASTTTPAGAIQIVNTTGSLIKLAIGAPGSEVDIPYYLPSGEVSPVLAIDIKRGSRISARAVDTNSTGGQLAVNLLG